MMYLKLTWTYGEVHGDIDCDGEHSDLHIGKQGLRLVSEAQKTFKDFILQSTFAT